MNAVLWIAFERKHSKQEDRKRCGKLKMVAVKQKL